MHSDVPASQTESKRPLFVTDADDGDSQWLLDVHARLISGVSLCEQVPPNWNQDVEVSQSSFFFFTPNTYRINVYLSLDWYINLMRAQYKPVLV